MICFLEEILKFDDIPDTWKEIDLTRIELFQRSIVEQPDVHEMIGYIYCGDALHGPHVCQLRF